LAYFRAFRASRRRSGAFCSREKEAEVEQFFKEHPVPAAERTLRQAFERIDAALL
jgi:hypothetical protein